MTNKTDEFWFLDSRIRVAVSQRSNGDRISVLVHEASFGEAPPLHVHYGEDEIFHILDGEMEFDIDGTLTLAWPGDTICAPRGVPHRFRVISKRGARYLTVTRGGFEDLVRTFGSAPQGPGLPRHETPTPAMQAALASACFANGINVIGPPMAASSRALPFPPAEVSSCERPSLHPVSPPSLPSRPQALPKR